MKNTASYRERLNCIVVIVLFAAFAFFMSGSAFAEPGDTFLEAVVNGNMAKVKAMLEKQPEFLNAQDESGNNALHAAAYYGKGKSSGQSSSAFLEIIELLTGRGLPVDSQNVNGQTPLHLAAMAGNLEVVELLLQKGASIKILNKKGEPPLQMAAHGHNQAVAELLIAKGADVNLKSSNGSTPLHQAAFVSDPYMVKFLLSKGAKINAQKKDGNTPLHMAALGGDTESVKILLSSGADKTIKNKDGQTPLDIGNDEEVLKILRGSGDK
ncbi:MAG: ankyrin repeat domain-containing protein [Vulcanimicrobiota bacterium]